MASATLEDLPPASAFVSAFSPPPSHPPPNRAPSLPHRSRSPSHGYWARCPLARPGPRQAPPPRGWHPISQLRRSAGSRSRWHTPWWPSARDAGPPGTPSSA
eukprot:CAMPEP_0182908962 /NCGR_PEP_ID=MMETSP0034_2-20130328/35492_1 /TAXON_ID=156128 /ORGANISM="Nephroselmis pyriformis, Strain CCMP717" /LENGTH=101 /DNA_ID=CAMNT_0025045173 /DNA_START=110 /DNA_END=411 /DNA_ORIENTATION=-